MVLYIEDWDKYPNAIVDKSTKNKHFLEFAGLLFDMGIKNNAFPLILHNPKLVGVDPHSPNLTLIEILMVTKETYENPWYYFRECVKAPAKSGIGGSPFKANRGNIATIWLFFNSITTLLIQPRQTGKSFVVDSLMAGLLNVWCKNTSINLLTKNESLRTETVARIKEIFEYLPPFLNLRTKRDADNSEYINVGVNKNIYKTHVGQASKKGAFNAARGLSSPIFHVDELAYLNNARITIPAALPATGAVMDEAELKGEPNGILFTTTSGWLDSDSGSYAYEIYCESTIWTEKFYDVKDKKTLLKILRGANGLEQVLVDMNHQQLGYTDAWLKGKILKSKSKGGAAETDYLNIWASGSAKSPFDKKIIADMNKTIKSEPNQQITNKGYVLRWYVDDYERLVDTKLVIGLDTSDAVGNDDIGMVIRRVNNGEVVAVGQFNETNVISFSTWLADFMIEYHRSVLIVERRSTGGSVIDNLFNIFTVLGINPYTRLFNWITQEKDANPNRYSMMLEHKFDSGFQNKHRKEVGYATSNGGRASRDKLYGETLTQSMKFTSTKIYDKPLVTQISGLMIKNGRIDHSNEHKDDLVIGWLLGYWFLSNSKNVEVYGLDASELLQDVMFNNAGTEEEELAIINNEAIKERINKLLNKLAVEKNKYILDGIIKTINRVREDMVGDMELSLNLNNALHEIALMKKSEEKTDKKISNFGMIPTHT